MNDLHHLDKHPRGAWRMSVTVPDSDPTKVGNRIKVPLLTHDEQEARIRRDIALGALIRAGVKVRAADIEAGDNSSPSTAPRSPA